MRPKAQIRMLNGYRVIYDPTHKKSMTSKNWEGYVYEHIVVLEQLLQRSLHTDEVTHHIDGDRANNAKENLLVMYNDQHTKLHNWLRKGAPGIERFRMNGVNSGKPKLTKKVCETCGVLLYGKHRTYCSKACYSAAMRSKWPTKEELQNELASGISWCAIGRKYGVSDNAMRKRARAYGLIRQS